MHASESAIGQNVNGTGSPPRIDAPRLVGSALAIGCLLGCSAAPTDARVGPQAGTTREVTKAEAAEISAFVDADSKVRLSRAEDLDGDGDLDLVAVTEPREFVASGAPRTLLILRRGPDGRLTRAVENPRAVLAADRGGVMASDPLRDLAVHPGGFTLRFEGGSRELWSQEFSFQYAPGRDTWLLTRFHSHVLDRHEGTRQQRTLDARDIGDVTVAEFDPDALAAD